VNDSCIVQKVLPETLFRNHFPGTTVQLPFDCVLQGQI
jgi:hypothetical protein